MGMNLQRLEDQSSPPTHRGDPTRRHLVIGLPAAGGAGALALAIGATPASQVEPVGEEAARLAADVRAAEWRATTLCEAMLRYAAGNILTSLLVSYAAVHEARLGTPASAPHMLAVSDTLRFPPRGPGRAPQWWGAWRDGLSTDFDSAKFGIARAQARLIELERGDELAARLKTDRPYARHARRRETSAASCLTNESRVASSLVLVAPRRA